MAILHCLPDLGLTHEALALDRPQWHTAPGLGMRFGDRPQEYIGHSDVHFLGVGFHVVLDLGLDLLRDAENNSLTLTEFPHPHASLH